MRQRRIGTYGICRDTDGRILLVRESDDRWWLPGGGVEHGEHPFDALRREVREETGLEVEIRRLRDAVADVVVEGDLAVHTDRLLFDVEPTGGALRAERGEAPRWVAPDELTTLPLSPATAAALGVPVDYDGYRPGFTPLEPDPDRVQRFGAYGFVTDPAGRVLLTLIADGYPGAGRWHLPGGGTDYGEQPGTALIRELVEETGQYGHLVELLGVASHRDAASLGPEGYPIDWHGVRAFYRVAVDLPSDPVVHDVGGSTAEARWFIRTELDALELTEVTAEVLRALAS